MAEPATRTTAPPTSAPPAPAPRAAEPQADGGVPGNAAFGALAEGGFLARLGTGLRLSAADLRSAEGVDLPACPSPCPACA